MKLKLTTNLFGVGRHMRVAIASVAFMLLSMVAQAQNKTITGKVTDDKGVPLPSANVNGKGTNVTVRTENDGTFSITVPNTTRTLIVSFSGFEKQEVSIGTGANLSISLVPQGQRGEEVVVVGYGTQRKKDVTASVATIGSDKIKNVPAQSFEQILQGKATGLNIIIPNGVLNNPPVLRVRGVNSINGSSFPLVVIDGVPLLTGDASTNLSANNALGNINPSDIEDVQILKDAAAGAIYGSRAANGVMLITTKKGKQGKAKVTYDVWGGYTQAYKLFDVLGAKDYVEIKNEAIANSNFFLQPSNLVPGLGLTSPAAGQPLFFMDTDANGKPIDTDWKDEIFQRGFQHSHTLSVSGANGGTRYYFSTNYTNQDGILQTNNFDRKQVRMNLEQKVNDWLKVGGNINFARTATTSPNSGSLPGTPFSTAGAARLAFVTAPNISPYLPNGDYNYIGNPSLVYTGQNNQTLRNNFNQIGRGKNLDRSGFYNPVMIRDLNKISSNTDNIIGDVSAEFKLYKGLTFRTQYGINWLIVDDRTFYNSLHGDGIQTPSLADDGRAFNALTRANTTNFQNVLNYNTKLKNKHSIGFTVGHEENAVKRNGWGASRSNLGDIFYNEFQGSFTVNDNPINNFITENYLLSFFSRINYNFDNKYYFSINGRRDGYSAFADGKKWGNFGGVSAGWNVSEMGFYKGKFADIVTGLKVRGSYGTVGNITAVGDFASLSQFGPGAIYGNGNPSLVFSRAGNKNLSWESSRKFDAGLELSFKNDLITAEISYYKTDLSDLIIGVPTPTSMGIPGNNITANAASMYNKGIELAISAKIINKRDFNWSATFNITTQKNRVTKLAPGVPEIIGITQLERTNITRVGHSIGSFFLVKNGGVDPATGRRIFINRNGQQVFFKFDAPTTAERWKFADGTNAPQIDLAGDGYIAGSALPTYYGGLINNLSYKNFDINLELTYSGGNKVYFGSRAGMLDQRFWNNLQEVKQRWTKPGDKTQIPRLAYNDNISNGSAIPMDFNLFNGSFVRVRNIAFGYTFDKSITDRIKMGSIRAYIQAQNPFLFTKYPGSDPEISVNGGSALTPGVDRNTIGQARTVTFGLNVGF